MIRVTRRDTPPSSLAAKKSFNGNDVRNALAEDFHNKCYLCEGVLNAGLEVDHFRPRSTFREFEFTWKNLFPVHPTCNKRRKKWNDRRWPKDGMLDCASDDIKGRLAQRYISDKNTVRFVARRSDDISAGNTATELSHIHDTESYAGRMILSQIEMQYKILLQLLKELLGAESVGGLDNPDAILAAGKLRRKLAVDAPYAGVLRDTFRELLIDNPEKRRLLDVC